MLQSTYYAHLEDNQPSYFSLCDFKIIPFEQAIDCDVTHLLVALGSNWQPQKHLAFAEKKLAELGSVQFSKVFVNPDYTVNYNDNSHNNTHNNTYNDKSLAKADYSNQCAIIELTKPSKLDELIKQLKSIEDACQRQRYGQRSNLTTKTNLKVSLDIDVLAVILAIDENPIIKKSWFAIDKRYPFRHHEWVGVEELFFGGE